MTRLSAVLGLLVVVFALIDIHLLMTPVAEVFGATAIGGGLIGIFLCLYGIQRRSKRLHTVGFWASILTGTVLIVAVGLLYSRALNLPKQLSEPSQLVIPKSFAAVALISAPDSAFQG